MAPPPMTPGQRAAALEKALQATHARTAALKALRAGAVTFAEVLADQDSPLQRARVRQVLLAVPKIGGGKADGILAELKIDAARRIAGPAGGQPAIANSPGVAGIDGISVKTSASMPLSRSAAVNSVWISEPSKRVE